jgi:Rieske 2Fe-2S family protein
MGNWKLVVENNRECQHCDVSHPELIDCLFPVFGFSEETASPKVRAVFERMHAATAELDRVCDLRQFPRDERRELDTRPTGLRLYHLPLDGDGISYGPRGSQLSKVLMGSVTESKFGDLGLHLQPNAWFHFLSDHAIVFRVLPISANKSVVRTTWLVHPDAVEGVDYDIEALTKVWRATNLEDRELVNGTQSGVTNPAYLPGPYSLAEDDVEAFVNWYILRLQTYVNSEAAEQSAARRLSDGTVLV